MPSPYFHNGPTNGQEVEVFEAVAKLFSEKILRKKNV